MPIDRIKPLKIENSALGGTENDPFPTECDPSEDHLSAKGIAFEGNEVAVISAASGLMSFQDTEVTTAVSLKDLAGNPRSIVTLFDDFISATSVGSNGWSSVVAGAGSATTVMTSTTVVPGRPGILICNTGTTTTGRAADICGEIRLSGGAIVFESDVLIPILATVGEDYNSVVGFSDTGGASSPPVSGVHFQYNRGVSVNWRCITMTGGTSTVTTTTDAASTAWVKLGIKVNAAATSIDYLINGTVVATHTTNIPTTGGICPIVKIVKIAGTTARTIQVDYVNYTYTLTTGR